MRRIYPSLCPIAYHLLTILCFSLIGTVNVYGQELEDLKSRSAQINDRIRATQELLEKTKKNSQSKYAEWVILQRNINKRKSYIQELRSDKAKVENEIAALENDIGEQEKRISILKEEFGKMLRKTHTLRMTSNFSLYMLSAQSVNQAFLRWRYFRQIAKSRKRQFNVIKTIESELNEKKNALVEKRQSLLQLEAEASAQVAKLDKDAQAIHSVIEDLKKNQKELNAKLNQQRKQQEALRAKITEVLKAVKKKTSSKLDIALSKNFSSNRGRLPWPVDQAVVVRGFGPQRHPFERNIKIQSNGVDVKADVNQQALCVFEGEVLSASKMPGYGHAVFVQHGDYLTVYAKLAEVHVLTGEKLKTGDVIGSVLSTTDDPMGNFHFEIWKNGTPLDPEAWLR